jgi:hypothetical protein
MRVDGRRRWALFLPTFCPLFRARRMIADNTDIHAGIMRRRAINDLFLCPGGGMVDAFDLKLNFRKEVWVRVPPRALNLKALIRGCPGEHFYD